MALPDEPLIVGGMHGLCVRAAAVHAGLARSEQQPHAGLVRAAAEIALDSDAFLDIHLEASRDAVLRATISVRSRSPAMTCA